MRLVDFGFTSGGRATLICFALLACNGGDKDPPVDTADTDVDTDPPPMCVPADAAVPVEDFSESPDFDCLAEFNYSEVCNDKVVGVRVSAPLGFDPETVKVKTPAECNGGSRNAFDMASVISGSEWVAEAGDDGFCPGVANDTSALICNSDIQAASDTWQVFLPYPENSTDCSDYGTVTLEFLEDSGPECADEPHAVIAGCTPQMDVPLELLHFNWRDLDGDGFEHSRLLPLVTAGGPFTERAWLRSIEVTNFGDAAALHLVGFGDALELSGDTVVGGHILDSTNDTLTFAEGEVVMGTTFVVDGVAPGPFITPSVTVSWSCGYNVMDPHFSVHGSVPQGYAKRLDQLGFGMLTADQRVVVRIVSDTLMSFELEGRHHDRVFVPIVEVSPTEWTFDYLSLKGGGIEVEGTAELVEGDLHLDFDTLILRSHDIGPNDWTFEAI